MPQDQVKYTQKLRGDRVLVIGGSSGIGFAVAEALVENGCKVIISSSNPKRVESTIELMKKSYPSSTDNVTGHACNLGDQATLESNIEQLFETVGKLDHVIFTAGDALAAMPIADATMDKIVQAGMVRFFAPMIVGKVAPKYLSGGPKSSITLTTGAVSEKPIDDWSVIGSYAAGLHGMTRGLALDLKPIRVNLISPGAVQTELWANTGMNGEQIKGLLSEMGKKMPTGQVPGPEQLAESYLYLLKDHNITGSMISTNGGSLLT